jgi:kinetochore protein Fta7
LEAQLTASLHSIELLKAEIEYEESELVGAEERLASMKKNAKKEEDLWKKQAKKIESMIDVKSDLRLLEDSPDAIGLVEQEDMVDSMFEDDYGDMELTPILSQLRSHLESIQFNSMQVQGIPDALADVSLALEWILQR